MSVRSRLVSIPLVAVAVGLPVFASTVVAAATPTAVFINEIDYDQPGTDYIEFVELAGPAGTSLDGWSIVLYDGVSTAPYHTLTLGGVLDDTGVVAIGYSNVIQNGDPDGIALVGPAGVAEFVSYGGSFAATSGVAAGMTSVDVGVKELAGSLSLSMQRVGTGASAADFTWTTATPSRGVVNAEQTFVDVAADGDDGGRACDGAQRPEVRPGAVGRGNETREGAHPGREHGCPPAAGDDGASAPAAGAGTRSAGAR